MTNKTLIKRLACVTEKDCEVLPAHIEALCKEAAAALEAEEWIKTTDRLPEKPGEKSYEYVDCLILVKGEIKMRPWNCEHLCWDDEEYDDFAYEATEPTHWKPLSPPEEKSDA